MRLTAPICHTLTMIVATVICVSLFDLEAVPCYDRAFGAFFGIWGMYFLPYEDDK